LLAMDSVAVILVTWNQRADVLECLASLSRTRITDKTVIVVDNGSGDGTPEAVRQRHPEADLLHAETNVGFAAANNLGIRSALERSPAYVFLLNTDTIVDETIFDHLVSAMKGDPRLGIAAPKMYYYHEPNRLWFAGGETDVATGFSKHWRFGEVDGAAEGALIVPCSFITGAGMFVRSSVFERVGLLEEAFFHTAEDTDFCLRAREAGFTLACVPQAKLWHKVRSTTGGGARSNPAYVYYEYRNKFLLAKKHASRRARVASMHRTLYRLARDEWAFLKREKNPRAAASVLFGVVDAFRGRTGKRIPEAQKR
jgi:GT2 family glycosyltransferase